MRSNGFWQLRALASGAGVQGSISPGGPEFISRSVLRGAAGGIDFVLMLTLFGAGTTTAVRATPPGRRAGLPVGDRSVREIRDALRAVRRPPDPFSLLDVATDALRPNEQAFAIANSLAVSLDGTEIDEGLTGRLAVVPLGNLQAFRRRGGRIMFASSFLAAADSDEANQRRGYPLDAIVRREYEDLDRPGAGVFGIYDQLYDALVFTSAARPLNHERVVLHEFGHAMTVRQWWGTAHLRADLLFDLPPQIDEVLSAYAQGGQPEAIRERVLEALAEAYVWALVGRWKELPARLMAIVQEVVCAGTEADGIID